MINRLHDAGGLTGGQPTLRRSNLSQPVFSEKNHVGRGKIQPEEFLEKGKMRVFPLSRK
jgi:hypothetical protein